jgi:hypothetical protein
MGGIDDLIDTLDEKQKGFITELHGKAGDPSFVQRAKAVLTFYTLAKSKEMKESLQEILNELKGSIGTLTGTYKEITEKMIKSNESSSKKMVLFTAGLFAVTAGLLFVGFVQLIKGL